MQRKQFPFAADPELIFALDQLSTPVDCKAGCVLFRQGDPPAGVYILKAGDVALIMNTHADDFVLSMQASCGSILGLSAVIGDHPFTLTAMAQAGARVSFVPREQFVNIMKSDHAISLNILKVLAVEVRYARQAMI